MPRVQLRTFCHSRSGDKGNDATVSVIAYREEDYPVIEATVTEDAVKEWFGDMLAGPAERFEMPVIGAVNFMLHDVLRGGSTVALHRDLHGKALSGALLDMEVEVPEGFVPPEGPF